MAGRGGLLVKLVCNLSSHLSVTEMLSSGLFQGGSRSCCVSNPPGLFEGLRKRPGLHRSACAAVHFNGEDNICPKSSDICILLLILGWTTALVGTGNYSEWKYSKGRINYLQPN